MLDKQKCIWITGGSSGIGKNLALKMASKGYKVAISARTKKKLQQVKKKSENLRGSIHLYQLDITSKKDIKKNLNKIEKEIGEIGTVVLNAALNYPVNCKNFSSEILEKLMKVNYNGTVNCLDEIIKRFIKKKSGKIAVVSSLAGYIGFPYSSGYCPTKAALINLCESLRLDLKQYNIVLQVINPGFVKTPMTDKNDFFMPFLISAEKAAEYIYKGLKTNRFEIIFPKIFAYILKLLRILPYFVLFPILKIISKNK